MRLLCKGEHLPFLIPGLRLSGAIPLLPHNTPSQDFMAGTGTTLRYYQSVPGKEKRRLEWRYFLLKYALAL